MSTELYSAFDGETDTLATLERSPVTGMFHVTRFSGRRMETHAFDWLPDAAHWLIGILGTFEDECAPGATAALDAIASQVDGVEVYDAGDGPFLLDTEED